MTPSIKTMAKHNTRALQMAVAPLDQLRLRTELPAAWSMQTQTAWLIDSFVLGLYLRHSGVCLAFLNGVCQTDWDVMS